MALHVEWESDERRMERCDHEGTTEPLAGGAISRCTVPQDPAGAVREGRGATVRIVSKLEGA